MAVWCWDAHRAIKQLRFGPYRFKTVHQLQQQESAVRIQVRQWLRRSAREWIHVQFLRSRSKWSTLYIIHTVHSTRGCFKWNMPYNVLSRSNKKPLKIKIKKICRILIGNREDARRLRLWTRYRSIVGRGHPPDLSLRTQPHPDRERRTKYRGTNSKIQTWISHFT